ncbi:MAG: hypothetical protein IPK99_09095 [Flavobacteriales bacterium]|nr:hypothetical protein [Flavobacteriales bacterium]
MLKLDGTDGSILFDQTSTAGALAKNISLDVAGDILIQGWCTTPFTLGGGPLCPFNDALGPSSTSLYVGKFDPSGSALWYHVPDQGQGFGGGNYYERAQLAVAPDGNIQGDHLGVRSDRYGHDR